jgi:hypothetical protein
MQNDTREGLSVGIKSSLTDNISREYTSLISTISPSIFSRLGTKIIINKSTNCFQNGKATRGKIKIIENKILIVSMGKRFLNFQKILKP